jgi:hypothetical protein
MRDDAIAPVIAVMLILAAIVTFYSLWNTIYVPSMKESAEVEHLENVESAFEHFSSDIDNAVSSHQDNLVFSEPVQLGGGDVMVNLIKSSGTLQVQTETDPIYTLTLTNGAGNTVALVNGTFINFSYEPVSNFWQDQGYRWQYGYINVTKYGELSTPLGYYNMSDVENEISTPGAPLQTFAQSFGSVDYSNNQTEFPVYDTNHNIISFSPLTGNCSSLNLWAVNITASPDHNFVSSNGFGTLKLTSNIVSIPFESPITQISFRSDQEPFGNATFHNLNASFAATAAICNSNIEYDSGDATYATYKILQSVSPVNVNISIVEIEVSAY